MIRFLLSVTILPMMMGFGLIRLKKEKGTGSLRECYMLGLLFLFLLGEAASCVTIKLEGSFSFYCRLFAGAVGMSVLLSLLAGWKVPMQLWESGKKQAAELKVLWKEPGMWRVLVIATGLLAVLPVAGSFLYVPDTGSSTMAETILATTGTDTFFLYNPVTGKALEYGMYPIYKLACLPLIYSALYELSGMALPVFLYKAVSFWMVLVWLVVLSLWGETLFGGNKEKKCVFLLLAEVLLVTGDGDKSTLAYGLLHGGFKGETLAALVVAFGAYMIYQLSEEKEIWYRFMGLLLAACGFLVARPLFLPGGFAYVAGNSGREWTLLALAVFALYLSREKKRKKWKTQEVVFLGICLFAGLAAGGAFSLLGTAYAGTCLFGSAEDRKKAVSMLIGLVLLFCFAGTVLPFRGDCVKKTDVPVGDVEILDRIAQLTENYEGEVLLAAPENVMEQARLYCDRVILPYGKDLWHEACNREIADVYTDQELLLFEQMKTDYIQPDAIAAMAAEMHCHILVMREEMSEEAGVRGGWKQAEGAEGYAVYYKQ